VSAGEVVAELSKAGIFNIVVVEACVDAIKTAEIKYLGKEIDIISIVFIKLGEKVFYKSVY
jgi:hypothetical protein